MSWNGELDQSVMQIGNVLTAKRYMLVQNGFTFAVVVEMSLV